MTDDYYCDDDDILAPPLSKRNKFHNENHHPVVFPCHQNLASRDHCRQSSRIAVVVVVVVVVVGGGGGGVVDRHDVNNWMDLEEWVEGDKRIVGTAALAHPLEDEDGPAADRSSPWCLRR